MEADIITDIIAPVVLISDSIFQKYFENWIPSVFSFL